MSLIFIHLLKYLHIYLYKELRETRQEMQRLIRHESRPQQADNPVGPKKGKHWTSNTEAVHGSVDQVVIAVERARRSSMREARCKPEQRHFVKL